MEVQPGVFRHIERVAHVEWLFFDGLSTLGDVDVALSLGCVGNSAFNRPLLRLLDAKLNDKELLDEAEFAVARELHARILLKFVDVI